ncbi:MAG TPA: phosphate acyltransferase, partial [Candidatus Ozemobacteraceae bacterium]|nr:phosphate acyltransferase [Candidatus Ozemobacteraceae bacterium]
MDTTFFGRLAGDLDRKRTCRIAVPFAQDEAVAYAICEAVRMGAGAATLVGDREKIVHLYGDIATNKMVTIVSESDPVKACQRATQFIRDGEADILMKGLVPTGTILKAVLNSQHGIKKNPLLSHLAFFELPSQPGLKILTDAALNIAPDAEMLVKIVENAVEAFRIFVSDRPARVALLAANEKVSQKLPSTVAADQVAKALATREEMIVEGPIS